MHKTSANSTNAANRRQQSRYEIIIAADVNNIIFSFVCLQASDTEVAVILIDSLLGKGQGHALVKCSSEKSMIPSELMKTSPVRKVLILENKLLRMEQTFRFHSPLRVLLTHTQMIHDHS